MELDLFESDESQDYYPTQTQTEVIPTQKTEPNETPWGLLFYVNSTDLPPIELFSNSIRLGRSIDCDIVISDSNVISKTLCIWNVSTFHCLIVKEDSCPVYISDMSKNGTFINGKLIGKGNKSILENGDVISITHKNISLFKFQYFNRKEDYLPIELQQNYSLSNVLGHGACGEVRLAFHKTTLKPYAIKKITKARFSTSEKYKLNHPLKIQTEIKILRKLNHPCIISMQDIVETERDVFIVLEYMQGGELTNLITSESNILTETNVKYLFYQIVCAVEYLHKQGITHRDLKPENVLLQSQSANTRIKISDFGLSKIMDERTMMQTICGTPYYVAPEILRHSPYSKQVDIWSMGIILYYMLCKNLPFQAPDRATLSRKIVLGIIDWENEDWNGISRIAKDLVKKMLNVNPQRRIKIEDIFQHSWISNDITLQYNLKNVRYGNFNKSDSDDSFNEVKSMPALKRPRLDLTDNCLFQTK